MTSTGRNQPNPAVTPRGGVLLGQPFGTPQTRLNAPNMTDRATAHQCRVNYPAGGPPMSTHSTGRRRFLTNAVEQSRSGR